MYTYYCHKCGRDIVWHERERVYKDTEDNSEYCYRTANLAYHIPQQVKYIARLAEKENADNA